jgi:hypothetical protein
VNRPVRQTLLALVVLGLATVALPAAASHNQDLHSPNMQIVDQDPQTSFTNSDLAFWGNRLYAGNYGGFRIFDISNPANPALVEDFSCPGPQNDISVWNNDGDPEADLLLLSVDSVRTDDTCSSGAAPGGGTNDPTGWEGVRIFDINDETAPLQIAAVPTDCGSHTHTLVPTAANDTLYVYVSSYPLSGFTNGIDFADMGATGGADRAVGQRNNGTECLEPEPRPNSETGDWEANKTHSKISIIAVDLSAPEEADDATVGGDCDGGGPADTCVSYPAVTEWQLPLGTRPTVLQLGSREVSIVACHDIAVFIEPNLAAGACFDEGQLWDITNPGNPQFLRRFRNNEVDLLVHSATFSWDGETVAFEDEAGGGGGDRCRDPNDLQGRMWFYDTSLNLQGSFKIPRAQPAGEICTAHNYNIIPKTDDTDILVSAWYEGGTSVIDMTNPAAATEVGYYDAQANPASSDAWSSYWYNGFIYVNDIARGLDTMAFNDPLKDGFVALPFFNPQTQMDLIPQTPAQPAPAAKCKGEDATMVGTGGADNIVGTPGRDVIASRGGRDRVKGLGGNDLICLGGGKDTANGGGGRDRIFGQGGRDTLKGAGGRDALNGGPKRDLCNGGPGRDTGKSCEVEKNIP